MARLTWEHSEVEQRKVGTIKQTMKVVVEYDPESDTVDEVVEVTIQQEAGRTYEVSKLLGKAEGSPLDAMLDAIPWREVYRSQYTHKEEYA